VRAAPPSAPLPPAPRNACHGDRLALHVRRGGLALETLVLGVRHQQRDEVRRVHHSEHTTLREIHQGVFGRF